MSIFINCLDYSTPRSMISIPYFNVFSQTHICIFSCTYTQTWILTDISMIMITLLFLIITRVKYAFWNNIESADENLILQHILGYTAVSGQYFLVITQNINTTKCLDLTQVTKTSWGLHIFLYFSSLFLHVMILLLSNWHLIFLALKMCVVRVVECNMWYFNIVTLNAT